MNGTLQHYLAASAKLVLLRQQEINLDELPRIGIDIIDVKLRLFNDTKLDVSTTALDVFVVFGLVLHDERLSLV